MLRQKETGQLTWRFGRSLQLSIPSLLNSTALLRVCRAGALGLAFSGALLTPPAVAAAGGYNGTPGADSVGGVGGLGGGAGGGAGGAGVNPGGAGGTAADPDGQDGAGVVESSSPVTGASGGGGGYNGNGAGASAIENAGTLKGGNGGNGGSVDISAPYVSGGAGGGFGGAGGYGAVVLGSGASVNTGSLLGGNGGSGGSSGRGTLDAAGGGGQGGVGVLFTTPGVTFTNSGIISGGAGGRGGDGGANGVSGGFSAYGGAGGDAVVMDGGGSVTLGGTVTGGRGGDGGGGPVDAGDGGNGGSGVLMNSIGTVTVNGAVTGGAGGAGGISAIGTPFNGLSGNAGYGIRMMGGGDVIVNGSVTAGAGGAADTGVKDGGTGIRMDGAGTVTVNGIVKGGQGSAGLTGMTGGGGAGITMAFGGAVTVNSGGAVIGGDTGINGAPSSGGFGIIGADLTVINSGTISAGNGVSGANAVAFFGGTNVYEMHAGASVNGGVMDATGNGTFRLGGAANGTFDASSLASTIGGSQTYQGFSTFEKTGSSVWTVTGTASAFTGDVQVNAGTLVVNGDLSAASSMFVNPGGTLSGTGIVPFTLLDNGATLAPGPINGTGTLTINDRVMFCACSTYAVKVSATGNDRANIVAGGLGTGDAFLAGLVRVTSPTGSYRFNSAYTILTTQGGLNGTVFDQLITPTGMAGALSYTSNDVLLTLTSHLSQITGLSGNQQRLANVFDNAINSSGTVGALGAIFGNNVAQNLTQASGELGTGSQQTTYQAMNLFMGLITDPFSAGRGVVNNGPTAFADESESMAYAGRAKPKSPNDAFAAFTKAPPAVFAQRWNVWAAGYGGSQTTDGNAATGSNNTRSSIYGAAAGADYWFSPDTVAGFALAGGGTNFSVANSGNGRSDMFQAGAFVRQNFGATYLTASAAYGWQDVTTDRYVSIAGADHLRANFNANAYSGRIELGHRFLAPQFGGVGVTPYAAAQVTAFDLPSYAERAISGAGTFALNYGADTVTSSRTELGLRTDKSYALDGAVLTLRGRAAWAHDFNPDRAATATFQTLPGASFVVNGAALASDTALTTASAELRWLNGWSVAGTFEGEFSNVTRSYAGKGVVRYNW